MSEEEFMMLLHIVLSDDNIQRVRTESLPETVDELKMMLKTRLNLEGDMVIQFQDEEFGGQFCNLTNMDDLPSERVKLKVIMKAPPSSPQSDYTLDTASLDTSSQSSGETSGRSKPWPNPFPIPTFSYDIEMKLRRGNEAYQKDGSLLPLSSHTDVKVDILDKLGRAMYDFNAYPTQKQIEEVAKTLVEKHPCLKEPGSKEGFYCWKFSLSFKMGNLRQKYRIAGCSELTVNRKRTGGQETRKMKKARRSETNFLPDFPQGRSANSLEEERECLIDEVKKKKPDCNLIDSLMGRTFALRRQEIVVKAPLVTEIESRWPALFSERQVNSNIIYILHLFAIAKSNQNRRSTALLGLPFILKEDPSNVIKFSEVLMLYLFLHNVGQLIITEQNVEMRAQLKNIVDVAIILEENIVLRELQYVPNGFAVLMGLLYYLNIDFPKDLKYTFEVIQKVIMDIGGSTCSARLIYALEKVNPT
uniref:Uncharacterized protein n=1 Tax=Salarias fasciatus TaxID=181472 RepID=A0A672GF38_SALFA